MRHAPSTSSPTRWGILLRQCLQHHETRDLGRVVTLAPPNQGSEVVGRIGRVPGFRRFNGPAFLQPGTGKVGQPRRLGAMRVPVGVIAGTRSVNWLLSTALPGPNDGKVSVTSMQVAGMADLLCLPVSHPFIKRDARVIAAALNFVRHERFAEVAR